MSIYGYYYEGPNFHEWVLGSDKKELEEDRRMARKNGARVTRIRKFSATPIAESDLKNMSKPPFINKNDSITDGLI